MRRALLAALVLLCLASLTAGRAQAYESWCFDDPIVAVNGRLVDIRVQMPVRNLLSMRSTTLTVIIPKNTTGAVVVDDISAFPMKTTVSATGPAWDGRGALPITVVTNVSAATSYPIKVTALPVASLDSVRGLLNPGNTLLAGSTSATGTANTPLKMSMFLGR
jgi:hypothetical protein